MKELINLYSAGKPGEQSRREMDDYEQGRKKLEAFFERIEADKLVDIYIDLKRKALGWGRESQVEHVFRKYLKAVLQYPDIEEGVQYGTVAAIQPMLADEVVVGRLKVFVKGLDAHKSGDFSKFLKVIIHEMAHVASLDNRLRDNQAVTGFQSASEQQSLFTPLNEAFTEYVADAVYSEYVRRTGNRKDTVALSYGPIDIQFDRENYGVYRQWLAVLIDELAKEAGVEKEEIIKSMLGHYMRADFPQEIEALYQEIRPQLQQEIKLLEKDPFALGGQKTHAADLEEKLIPKLILICRELLQKKEVRSHVEAIFGTDIFAGKRFVAR